MTLHEFIDKVTAEENINTATKDIAEYVKDKARKEAVHGCAVIDDETVKNWVLECREGVPKKKDPDRIDVKPKKDKIEKLKEEAIKDAQSRERPTTQRSKKWEMESLF